MTCVGRHTYMSMWELISEDQGSAVEHAYINCQLYMSHGGQWVSHLFNLHIIKNINKKWFNLYMKLSKW